MTNSDAYSIMKKCSNCRTLGKIAGKKIDCSLCDSLFTYDDIIESEKIIFDFLLRNMPFEEGTVFAVNQKELKEIRRDKNATNEKR